MISSEGHQTEKLRSMDLSGSLWGAGTIRTTSQFSSSRLGYKICSKQLVCLIFTKHVLQVHVRRTCWQNYTSVPFAVNEIVHQISTWISSISIHENVIINDWSSVTAYKWSNNLIYIPLNHQISLFNGTDVNTTIKDTIPTISTTSLYLILACTNAGNCHVFENSQCLLQKIPKNKFRKEIKII